MGVFGDGFRTRAATVEDIGRSACGWGVMETVGGRFPLSQTLPPMSTPTAPRKRRQEVEEKIVPLFAGAWPAARLSELQGARRLLGFVLSCRPVSGVAGMVDRIVEPGGWRASHVRGARWRVGLAARD